MSIAYRQGDLFASGLPALAHGVNCRGVMSAGIAKGFAARWPEMYRAYKDTCGHQLLQPGNVFSWRDEPDGPWVFNLATQRNTGPDAQPWAITTAIGQLVIGCRNLGIKQVGLPWIGCGIGGLEPRIFWRCLTPFERAPVDLIVYEYHPEVR